MHDINSFSEFRRLKRVETNQDIVIAITLGVLFILIGLVGPTI